MNNLADPPNAALSRHKTRPLRDPRAHRGRRNGRGLQGARHAAEARCSAEDSASGSFRGPRARIDVRRRIPVKDAPVAFQQGGQITVGLVNLPSHVFNCEQSFKAVPAAIIHVLTVQSLFIIPRVATARELPARMHPTRNQPEYASRVRCLSSRYSSRPGTSLTGGRDHGMSTTPFSEVMRRPSESRTTRRTT
jgi:hypothetical protein